MKDFALVICSTELKEPSSQGFLSKIKLFKPFFNRIKNIIKKQRFEDFVTKIELYDDLNVYIIKLPHTKTEIMNSSKSGTTKINKLIYAFCCANNISSCILPSFFDNSYLPVKGEGNIYFGYSHNGHFLFKSLLITVLNEICSYRGVLIGDLDFTIVHGTCSEELFKVVTLLSPHAKYLTIATSRKEEIEFELNNIYADTGLSIRVTSDYNSAFKDIDIIINLGSLNEFRNLSKVNTKAIIINYGDVNGTKFSGENIIINGIEIGLPEKIFRNLDKEIYKYYGKNEIAEIILSHKIYNINEETGINNEFSGNLYEEFKKDGYKISGFIGRHSTLKAKDII